jgi:hypothetical protein
VRAVEPLKAFSSGGCDLLALIVKLFSSGGNTLSVGGFPSLAIATHASATRPSNAASATAIQDKELFGCWIPFFAGVAPALFVFFLNLLCTHERILIALCFAVNSGWTCWGNEVGTVLGDKEEE